MEGLFDILLPYISLGVLGSYMIYSIAKLGEGTNLEVITKGACLIMFGFLLTMLGGHLYYLSGLFSIY